jgi:hypothetical protein
MTSFAGAWNATMDTPIGKIDAVFNITDHDGAIGGSASTDKETVDILDAAVDGDRLTWILKTTTPMKLTLKFDVTVVGDTMTGTAKAGILPASKVNGTRASKS